MSRKTYLANGQTWNWAKNVPFAQAVEIDDFVFIGGQQTLDSHGTVVGEGDIAAQTRNVFENMAQRLADAGLGMSDLVRLNTYYVFEGDDSEATRYWEDMTRVRLEYFPDPGPAATAVRVKGMPYQGQLIQIEGIAAKGDAREKRRRIMPDGSWDWSIAVPLSQGWRVGDRIFVGGQISADEQGKPVAAWDIGTQTRNIYGFIENVVRDAGGSLDDIVHVKICFKNYGVEAASSGYLDDILAITADVFREPGPVVTALGVDLLYPGLVLEIDAMAIVDPDRKRLMSPTLGGRYQPAICSDGWAACGETWVGGQLPIASDGAVLAPGDVAGQARVVFDRLRSVLRQGGADLDDLVKLNLFLADKSGSADVADQFHTVSRVWSEIAPDAHPAMTPVRVYGLPADGALVQANGIAMR